MIRLTSLATVAAALLLSAPAGASPFGAGVADCAMTSLPPQPSPPAVTGTHDGESHTFKHFGTMVAHMRVHDA